MGGMEREREKEGRNERMREWKEKHQSMYNFIVKLIIDTHLYGWYINLLLTEGQPRLIGAICKFANSQCLIYIIQSVV